MSAPKFTLVAGVSPYGDGSGYQATATVEDRGDGQGAMIGIEITYRIEIDKWPELRSAVDRLVAAARDLALPGGTG